MPIGQGEVNRRADGGATNLQESQGNSHKVMAVGTGQDTVALAMTTALKMAQALAAASQLHAVRAVELGWYGRCTAVVLLVGLLLERTSRERNSRETSSLCGNDKQPL